MWNNCASSIEEDMDILDVDEELKDDSLFAREDKTHDDVCNILQQWKMNMQPTQQQEQDYKLNSKTFTRPKKRSLNFMGVEHSNETQYGMEQMQNSNQNIALNMQNNNDPIMYRSDNSGPINLQIGGYVTNMHKSFLSDTSPPPSMDISLINNSLITSADFSNISFLQSTHENINLNTEKDILSNDCDYSFNDLLRDRKALDSLTLSADGTLIKDSNIAQIDDISLALSKTTSSCSTMDNSTNSVESSNVYFVEGLNKTYDGSSGIHDSSEGLNATKILVTENSKPIKLEKTIILSSDMIADTTFNLESISIIENEKNDLNVTRPITTSVSSNDGNKENEKISNITRNIASNVSLGALNNQTFETNENFKKPLIDETQNLLNNATFEMQNKNTPEGKRCETPENKLINFLISTPQTQNVYNKKQQFSPCLYKKDEVNISPIIGNNREMNETYDYMYHKNNKNTETFSGSPPSQSSIDLDNLITENLQHNHSFNKNYNELYINQENLVETEMGNLQDLANVEAKLLAAHDDGIQFDYMLEELSKVHMTDDHNKVKKSIESIKKRLNCVAANASSNSIKNDNDFFNNDSKDHEKSGFNLNRSLNDVKNDSLNNKENSSLSRSADRLLSRRSRLYDNINISTIQDNRKITTSDILNTTFGETNNTSTVLSGSTISNSKSNNDLNNVTQSLEETGKINESTNNGVSKDSSEETGKQNANTIVEKYNTQDKEYRPVPNVVKRERDRDRFKTIKIVRDHDSNKSGGSCLQTYNVPCIDSTVDNNDDIGNDKNGYIGNDSYVLDDKNQENETDLYINKDNDYSNQDVINAASTTINVPQFNNNESEYDANKVNTNYLTFKYPKDKQNKRQLGLKSIPTIDTQPVIKPPATTNTNTNNIIASSSRSSGLQAPRSSSRPRYLSGLQKFSAVSKATSAGDLDISSSNASSNESLSARKSKINGAGLPLNKTSITGAAVAATTSNLKSPMGIKSKSFHNLSNQVSTGIGLSSNPTKNAPSKLQRPGNKFNATTNCSEPNQNQKPDDSAFKVPKSFVRPSTASGIKRPGLPRPASGYYSLNNIPGKGGFTKVDIADNDDESSILTERSSNDSTRGNLLVTGQANKMNPESTDPKSAKPSTTPSSGIPKPSGLRPPSSVKRSGLPRPLSSIIKH